MAILPSSANSEIIAALYQAIFDLSLIDGARLDGASVCIDVREELAALRACLRRYGVDVGDCVRMFGQTSPANPD